MLTHRSRGNMTAGTRSSSILLKLLALIAVLNFVPSVHGQAPSQSGPSKSPIAYVCARSFRSMDAAEQDIHDRSRRSSGHETRA